MNNEREVSVLKSELNSVNRIKEDYFSQSKANGVKLKEINSKANSVKKERDALTKAVKEAKLNRDLLNKELKEKIKTYRKVAPKRKGINVAGLKKQISELEYKIETEAPSFEKEQKMMKLINEKKKQLKEAGVSEEAAKLEKELDEIRKKANEAHKLIQTKADESQKKHEELVHLLKEGKEAFRKQKEINAKIKEAQSKLKEITEQLNKKLEYAVAHEGERRESRPRKEFGHKKKFEKRKEHGPKINYEELQHKAEEKLKKTGKLTTQDLLAFQGR
jgi:uncharacterized coiled-coil DUF342 family protein